jgi:hypothetical protein
VLVLNERLVEDVLTQMKKSSCDQRVDRHFITGKAHAGKRVHSLVQNKRATSASARMAVIINRYGLTDLPFK